MGNGEVWGTAAIGAGACSAISSNSGVIGPYGSPSIVDAAVQKNFNAAFPDATAPAPAASYTIGTVGATTLPRGGDGPAPDCCFYYYISGISLAGNAASQLIINDKVALINTNPLEAETECFQEWSMLQTRMSI
jgi:hypothetical protein